MSKLKRILNSFKLKDTLNPKVWDNADNPEKAKMKSKVKNALEKIADEFIEYLGDDVFVQDIILTGSLSNYNWSEFSDFDLHVIIDFEEYGENSELYKELYDLKKFIFNTKHNIKIFGYDVELYAQDEKESHYASGVYSIMEDEWIKTPKKEKFDLDEKVLKEKITCWTGKIDKAIETATIDDDKEVLEKVKEKLKEYRKSGLEKDGELSYENLVFKFLRRSGHIEKLFDMNNKVKDKELSVEVKIQEQTENKKDVDSVIANSNFLKDLFELFKNGFSSEVTPGQKIPHEPEVEKIQTALQLLGFSLPKWGTDGKFGPETENSTKEFQKSVKLNPTGVWGREETAYLIAKLIISNFQDSKLSSVQKEKDFQIEGLTDVNFYEKLLELLGAPVTEENLKFLFAWRQAEGKGGKNNPFNTTWKYGNYTDFNTVGVKNYSTKEEGMVATLKTLLNGRYDCIVNGLKNNIGAEKIAECSSLETWGTGDLVAKVIKGYNSGNSPKISPLS